MEGLFIKVRKDGRDPERIRRVYAVLPSERTTAGAMLVAPDDLGQLEVLDVSECYAVEARTCMYCAKFSDDVGPYTPDLWLCGTCYTAHDRTQMARTPGMGRF